MGIFDLFTKKKLSKDKEIDSVANVVVKTFIANRQIPQDDGEKAINLIASTNPIYPTYHDQNIGTGEGDGVIELINNPYARDATFKEVMTYFIIGLAHSFMWKSNWAHLIHNDVEAYGIRCGWVLISKWHDTDAKIEKFGKDAFGSNDKNFSCLAFKTTDQGLVYIDCVPSSQDYLSNISYANVEVGQEYRTFSLFISDYFSSMLFVVDEFGIFW